MEENTPETIDEEALNGKLHELLDESDNEECDAQFCFQEETVEEVMQELYKEIAFPCAQNTSQVFINDGKNGSCGASVSDTASTVMAGIEVVNPAGGNPVTGNGSVTAVEVEEEKEMLGFYDGEDLDDEWIGKVLSWSQQNQVKVVDSRQWF